MSSGSVGARPAAADAAPNATRPSRTIRRRPCRSPSRPANGPSTAIATTYVVTSQVDAATPPPTPSAMSGRATASIVELSGRSVPLSATAARTSRGDGSRTVAGRGDFLNRPLDDADDAHVTVDLDGLAVGDDLRGGARADHGGDRVLARDHGAVAEHAAGIRDHGRDRRGQRRPPRSRRPGDQGGAPPPPSGPRGRAGDPAGPP